MPDVPSIWRVELYHPLVVHFPIVLSMSGTLAWLAGQVVSRERRWGFLLPAGRLALVAGAAAAWLAVYTGDLADAEVVRSLCDPTVVETHEELAYVVGWTFSGAVVVDIGSLYVEALEEWRAYIAAVVGAALIVGTATVGYVGHLGASLVYQQAAGVYQPTAKCTEFE